MYVVEALASLPMIDWRRYLARDLEKLRPKMLSAWHMKKFILEEEIGKAVKFTTEDDARIEAERIFQNVAKPSSQYIDLDDLNRFFPKEEALRTLKLFRTTYEDDEDIRITLSFLQDWMVHSFKRHRCLLLSVRDTDASSKALGIILSVVLGCLMVALAIPLHDIGGLKYMLALSTNSFILTYFFGQFCKEWFYSIHLLYIRHPFDVGDEVEIGEKKMYVEKLKMTWTYFVGLDKEKYSFSNYGICDKLIMNHTLSELPPWTGDDIV